MMLRPASLLFSINCLIATLLALYIAFSIGLPRPYWAMLTVYITSQPLTGALRSKAFYRVVGTVLGGIAAVVIVPTFVNAPALMALVIAAWVGLCLYVSLLDRTPRAYIFMLAGYTAAIIGFPSVGAPQAVFHQPVQQPHHGRPFDAQRVGQLVLAQALRTPSQDDHWQRQGVRQAQPRQGLIDP